jgi:hypothetical protein
MTENKKPWYKRWWAIVLFIFIGLAIIGSFLPNSSNNQVYTCPDGSRVFNIDLCASSTNVQNNQENSVTGATNSQTAPAVEENSDKATIGEKNSLNKALSYLRYTPFSYSGLVKQLEYEGYTHGEAVYGVDNCGADWNKQSALKAQSYLDYSAFSREGLINQLEFEGFTKEQSEYGVQAVGY